MNTNFMKIKPCAYYINGQLVGYNRVKEMEQRSKNGEIMITAKSTKNIIYYETTRR